MKIIKTLLVTLTLLAGFSAQAQEASWSLLMDTSVMKAEVMNKSFKVQRTQKGVEAGTLIGRMTMADGQIYLRKWYVTRQDCEQGHGQFVTTHLSGEFDYSLDFIIGGGTNASGIAQILCEVYKRHLNEIKDRSL